MLDRTENLSVLDAATCNSYREWFGKKITIIYETSFLIITVNKGK
jgi:hypothetical protein